jgi:hypothetical protein
MIWSSAVVKVMESKLWKVDLHSTSNGHHRRSLLQTTRKSGLHGDRVREMDIPSDELGHHIRSLVLYAE